MYCRKQIPKYFIGPRSTTSPTSVALTCQLSLLFLLLLIPDIESRRFTSRVLRNPHSTLNSYSHSGFYALGCQISWAKLHTRQIAPLRCNPFLCKMVTIEYSISCTIMSPTEEGEMKGPKILRSKLSSR